MEFNFSPDTVMLRDMLRRFIEKEVQPLEMKYFTKGEIEPAENARLQKVIEQMGLWGATTPEEFGGMGLDLVTTCLLAEELGKTFIPLEIGEVHPLLYACKGNQVQCYLEPALAGQRHAILAMREAQLTRPEEWMTSVLQEGDQLILNGKKLLSAMPQPEDFLIVFAKSSPGISAFILEVNQPGLTFHKNEDIELTIKDCPISSEWLLGESGKAFVLGEKEIPRYWIRIGAQYLGMAERLLAMAAAYANDWVVFGAPIKARIAVQNSLADMQVQIESTRWLIYHAAWMADQGDPVRLPSAQVRLAAGAMLIKVVDLATMIFGGPGPSPQIDLQRFVLSKIPTKALEFAMDTARTWIAEDVLLKNKGA